MTAHEKVPAYDTDLAWIHDSAFGQIARAAAATTLATLAGSGWRTGTIVELGCGSGIGTEILSAAGYDVIGVDLSPAMLAIARRRAPNARLHQGSFTAFELPRCVAVMAAGEVLNYRFDTGNGNAARAELVRRVHAALVPGGALVLDLAGPARLPPRLPWRTERAGDDWTVRVEVDADAARSALIRRIAATRRVEGSWRSSEEIHTLDLVEPKVFAQLLTDQGFSVATAGGYVGLPLPEGLTVFVARKRGQ